MAVSAFAAIVFGTVGENPNPAEACVGREDLHNK